VTPLGKDGTPDSKTLRKSSGTGRVESARFLFESDSICRQKSSSSQFWASPRMRAMPLPLPTPFQPRSETENVPEKSGCGSLLQLGFARARPWPRIVCLLGREMHARMPPPGNGYEFRGPSNSTALTQAACKTRQALSFLGGDRSQLGSPRHRL
jgi:hypothetical protein